MKMSSYIFSHQKQDKQTKTKLQEFHRPNMASSQTLDSFYSAAVQMQMKENFI